MPWFKVDDAFHSHPKVIDLGLAAFGLWVRSGSYCAQHLTDGFVPIGLVRQYSGRHQARDLVAAGLWDEVPGGYRFHQWLERNPSREQIETERESKRTAGRAGGKASGQSRSSAKHKASSRFASASEESNPRPDPTRPDPTQPVPTHPVPGGSELTDNTTTIKTEAAMNRAPNSSEDAREARERANESDGEPSLAARCRAARPAGVGVDYWTDTAVAEAVRIASCVPVLAARGVDVVMLALAEDADVRSPKAINDTRLRPKLLATIKQASKRAKCDDCKDGLPVDEDRDPIPCPSCNRGGVEAP